MAGKITKAQAKWLRKLITAYARKCCERAWYGEEEKLLYRYIDWLTEPAEKKEPKK